MHLFYIFYFLDESGADEWGEVEVERRNGLSAVHLVLRYFERHACKYGGGFDAFGRTAFAMSGDESVFKYAVERVLNACQTFCGVVVLVVDVDISGTYGIARLGAQQVIVDKRLCGLAGKFHHHACRRVRVHIGVFTSDVVVFRFYDFVEHVAGFGPTRYASLVAVCDIAFCHFLSRAVHKL